MPDRAVLFIDGNNWYHSLKEAGVDDLGRLNYVSISEKLVGPRDWIGTRYYIGRVSQKRNRNLYAGQRRFLGDLRGAHPQISVHLYDSGYLLSADGDFTPAVAAVTSLGKTVYAASPGYGAQLGGVVQAFIRLKPAWFDDCY